MNTDTPQKIFDRAAYRRRRSRRSGSDPILLEDVTAQIAARIGAINRRFDFALDLGSRSDAFPLLADTAQNWVRAGPSAEQPNIIGDEEYLPFADDTFDLVTSILSLHSVNDLPGALIQIRRALKPDGVFMGALFGGQTLAELKLAFAAAEANSLGGASPRVAPFTDIRDAGALLQRAGFALPVADLERTTIRYREPMRLFADLRELGETNVLTQRRPNLMSRRVLQSVLREYSDRFGGEDGRVPATFDVIYVIGWAPHESQPKPLRPGSATTSLSDALKRKENH